MQTGIGIPKEPVFEGQPDGRGGGSGALRRGVGAALSGTKTLIHNPQLLWFTFLAGLVLVGSAIAQAELPFIDWPLQPYLIGWIVLEFSFEFAALFCLVFLLASLVMSLSSKKEGRASVFEGFCGAKKYIKPLVLWSAILACAGMLLYGTYQYFPVGLWRELGFFDIFEPNNVIRMLSQFPFNFTLDPRIFQELPGPGLGRQSLVILLYLSGFTNALVFSAINLLLFILTLFVVPLIVLEQKTLMEAVEGSFSLLKKTWNVVTSCALFLGGIVLAAFLTYLLVQSAHGMITTAVTYRSTEWIALGLLYDLALFTFAVIVATVGGIAARELYLSAKTGLKPGFPEP
jgi:hypothetical protein